MKQNYKKIKKLILVNELNNYFFELIFILQKSPKYIYIYIHILIICTILNDYGFNQQNTMQNNY